MKPLENILVVELSTFFVTPSCGRILLTQGARVIKVETSRRGDTIRYFGHVFNTPLTDEENPIYDFCNGGKEDLYLDLKKPEDMERLHILLSKADVFLTNYRPAVLKNMGLDYNTLKVKYPRLVMATGTGYGENGPWADMPGIDGICLWGKCGFLQDLVLDTDGTPFYTPAGTGDIAVGAQLAGAIGTALFNRERTGCGDHVMVSLYGTGIWFAAPMSTGTQYGYRWPRNRYETSPMGRAYKTKDGEWVFSLVQEYDRFWRTFCEAYGMEEYLDHPQFSSKTATLDPDIRRELIKIIEEKAAQRDSKDILEVMEKADLPGCKLSHFADIHTGTQLQQAEANGYLATHTYPSGKTINLAQPPIYFASLGVRDTFAVHHKIGEDNDEIFKEFGL